MTRVLVVAPPSALIPEATEIDLAGPTGCGANTTRSRLTHGWHGSSSWRDPGRAA